LIHDDGIQRAGLRFTDRGPRGYSEPRRGLCDREESKDSALNGIESVKRNAPDAEIEDKTGA
jgi:hypothetical protein